MDNFQIGETISGNVSVKRYFKMKITLLLLHVCDGRRSLDVLYYVMYLTYSELFVHMLVEYLF